MLSRGKRINWKEKRRRRKEKIRRRREKKKRRRRKEKIRRRREKKKRRRNGLDMVRATGARPIHPTTSTPGGITSELDEETQADLLIKAKRNVELAQATIDLFVLISIFENASGMISIFFKASKTSFLRLAAADTLCNSSLIYFITCVYSLINLFV